MVKSLPAMQETWVRSLGREDPLEKEMATHSSNVAWGKSHGWRSLMSLVGYRPRGHKESDTTERLTLSLTQRLPYVSPLLISPQENHSFDICYCRLGLPVLNFTCMEYCRFYSLSMTVRLIRVLRPFLSSITTNVTATFQASSALSLTAGWLPSLAGAVPVTGSTGPPAALRAPSLQWRFFCLSVCHWLRLSLIYF